MSTNVEVKLFGGFTVCKDGEQILENLSNTRKTKLFLCYLLLNKDKAISHKELFELLWSGEDYSNPGTALRTLLYRYRAMIDSVGITSLRNSIISRRGAYQWNPDLDVSIDIFEFEKIAKRGIGEDCIDEKKAIFLRQAIEKYTGNLLPESNTEHWVVPKAVYLRELYIKVCMEYINILKKKEAYDEIVKVCTNAQKFVPGSIVLENELSIARQNGAENEKVALEYNVVDRAMYELDLIIDGVQEEMEADSSGNTAFVCEYEMFRQVYRLQRRLLLRTGETMFLTIVTLRSKNVDRHEPIKNERAMSSLLDCCKHELRMGDSICRYSEDQYAILFPVDSYENALKVMERVRVSFYKKSNLSEYVLAYKIRPLKNAKE